MVKKEKLYRAFGELIYAIAIADGEVQTAEIIALKKYLAHHPYAGEIEWSFNYEKNKHHNLEEAYKNAIEVCKENGPDPEYKYLLDVLIGVADAYHGIVSQEQEVIDKFKHDLKERFIKDLKENKLAFDED